LYFSFLGILFGRLDASYYGLLPITILHVEQAGKKGFKHQTKLQGVAATNIRGRQDVQKRKLSTDQRVLLSGQQKIFLK
jgi:hypothetical protein